jgi:hypothetical protein
MDHGLHAGIKESPPNGLDVGRIIFQDQDADGLGGRGGDGRGRRDVLVGVGRGDVPHNSIVSGFLFSQIPISTFRKYTAKPFVNQVKKEEGVKS